MMWEVWENLFGMEEDYQDYYVTLVSSHETKEEAEKALEETSGLAWIEYKEKL